MNEYRVQTILRFTYVLIYIVNYRRASYWFTITFLMFLSLFSVLRVIVLVHVV
jgi:hypothetical protein